LSATNQRLFLAAILAILAAVVYVAPFAAFFIAPKGTTEKRFCVNFICLRARYRAFGGAFRSAR